MLSRTRLLGLIERFHLYRTYANSPDDQVAEDARRHQDGPDAGSAQGGKAGELIAFKISYKAPNAAAAQKVNAALASFFVDENVRASQEQSESTTLFLESQVRAAGQSLADQEAKLRPLRPSTTDRCPSNCKAISRS